MPIKPIDYSKSVIYKIQSIHDNNLLYIGSTTDFTRRKSEHKSRHKTKKAKVYEMIRENGGWDCFKMIVVKQFPCENKIELQIEEDNMMREMESILNMKRAYVPAEEQTKQKAINNKKYKTLHEERLKKESKEYYEKHKEEILKYQKEYQEKHKEEILKYQKEYKEKHKEQIKQKKKEHYIKKKQEEEAQQILEELWLCREREIIRNISIARDMDYDSLMAEFGSKN
jgi:transcription-repair coupling factor (superfamily II helicase)